MVLNPEIYTNLLNVSGNDYIFELKFDDERYPYLYEILQTLSDIKLLHNIAVVTTDPEYEYYKYIEDPLFQHYSRLPKIAFNKQLRVVDLSKQSPLAVTLIVSAILSIERFVVLLNKIARIPLEKEKLKLEIAKLKKENALLDADIIDRQEAYREKLQLGKLEQRESRIIERRLKAATKLHSFSIYPVSNNNINKKSKYNNEHE